MTSIHKLKFSMWWVLVSSFLVPFSTLICSVLLLSYCKPSTGKVSVSSNKLISPTLRWKICIYRRTFNVRCVSFSQEHRVTWITKGSSKSFLRSFPHHWNFKSLSRFLRMQSRNHKYSVEKMKSSNLWLHIFISCSHCQKKISSHRVHSSKWTMCISLLKVRAM